MCNAWNHSATCDCGFGGSGTGGGGGGCHPIYNLSSINSCLFEYAAVKDGYDSSFSAITEDAETYPTKCWWCGEPVYYHSNGYGDSVLFDSLGGSPWQVHECWSKYWKEEKSRAKVTQPVVLRNLEFDQLKRLVLAGAIQKLRDSGFNVTENRIAVQIGISVGRLRQEYSHLYELYRENQEVQIRLK